ncbi:MAG: hypothetical protein H6581_14245 [Bacteroidia bacterium]|nr:hypothetical protein [Bacteroidia bacterium]
MKNYLLNNTKILQSVFQSLWGNKFSLSAFLVVMLIPALHQAQTSTGTSPVSPPFLAQVQVGGAQAADLLTFEIQTTSNPGGNASFSCQQLILSLTSPLAPGATVSWTGGNGPFSVTYFAFPKPTIVVDYGPSGLDWSNGLVLGDLEIDNGGQPVQWTNLLKPGGGMSISDNITTHTVYWELADPDTVPDPKGGSKWAEEEYDPMQDGWVSNEDLQAVKIFHLNGRLLAEFSGEELLQGGVPWNARMEPGIYLAVLKLRTQIRPVALKFMVR